MDAASAKRIYVDLEYCYPGMTRESGRPSATEQRQVVQIGAIIFDAETGQELANYNQLVVPAYTKPLPSFFTELTGITQGQVDESGIPYPEALRQFTAFCSDYPIWTFDGDWGVLRQNCGYFEIPFPFEKSPFARVKPLLAGWGIDAAKYSSGTLYVAAGLTMQHVAVHDALHDVRSMGSAVHVFEHRTK